MGLDKEWNIKIKIKLVNWNCEKDSTICTFCKSLENKSPNERLDGNFVYLYKTQINHPNLQLPTSKHYDANNIQVCQLL